MSGHFLLLVSPAGSVIGDDLRRAFDVVAARAEAPRLRWTGTGELAFAAGAEADGADGGVALVQTARLAVAGTARLDHPEEVASWGASPDPAEASDLELVAAALEARGHECIPRILGDFAVVVWNPATRELIAARDAFGVRTLFHAEGQGWLAFSSSAALLARDESYDREYLIEYLLACPPRHDQTAFASVRAVPPGTTMVRREQAVQVKRFWSPYDFSTDASLDGDWAVECFRELFVTAVTRRLTGQRDVWAELSGGLDSSSIVTIAQAGQQSSGLPGISGTVTAVDSLGPGDETAYVAAVLARYPTQNERVSDYWMWRDDGAPPPVIDHPYAAYPMFARDRRINALVRAGGGRVLLSGEGPDHYLTGSLAFAADLVASGRIGDALQEVAHWSGTLRTSFLRLAWRYAFAPMAPSPLRRLAVPRDRIPGWLAVSAAERRALVDRIPEVRWPREGSGTFYERWVAETLESIGAALQRPVIGESLQMRFPFLYRPLVEFSLRLPPRMRSQPHARKWVLREAMRGALPELVRLRKGKGGIGARSAWSLRRERERISWLLSDSVLCGTGLIDPAKLKLAVAAAIEGRGDAVARVMPALTLETWLSVRSGRWMSVGSPAGPPRPREHYRSRAAVYP